MPKLTGKSLPVRTRCTPGYAFACSTFTVSISACGCGERSRRMCSMRGRTMSSAKRVCPVTLARPSTLRRGLPMTFMAQPLCGLLDGLVDLLVAGTAAEIPRDRFPDALARRVALALEQGFGGHEDPRGAVAALRRAEVGESRLQRMQLRPARQAFHGVDAPSLAFHGKHQAGELRLAIDQHRAGAALAKLAAVLGAREAELFAQHLEKRLVRGNRGLVCLTVHFEFQLKVALHCLEAERISGTVQRKHRPA